MRSIQFRVTMLAGVGVVLLLAASALAMSRSFESRLLDQADTELAVDARVVRRAIDNDLIDPVRRSGVDVDLIVQVLDRRGKVIGGNAPGLEIDALIDTDVLSVGAPRSIETVEVAEIGSLRVLSEPTDARPRRLVVAKSIESVDDAVASLRRLALIGVPVIAVLLALLIWWVIGRALRPVERVRLAVAGITEDDLADRVPVPATGDEIARLAETMNDMLDRIERSVEREHRFVADASHELRSPLAGARALLETETDDPAIVAETRAETLVTIARLEAVAEQLLHLGGAGSAAMSGRQRSVDLDELVLAQAARIRRTSDHDVDTTDVSGGQVWGNENELGRLVENLTVNAVRHARSTVRFSVAETDDEVTFTVDDDGAGVPAEQREHIFLRFTRLDDSRVRSAGVVEGEVAGGTGLGLAIVDTIARAHGGSITVGDSDLGGARFEVRFPASHGAGG